MAIASRTANRLGRLGQAGFVAALSALLLTIPHAPSAVISSPSRSVSAKPGPALTRLPPALQAAASAVLGRAQAGYRLTHVANGFGGLNPAQGLRLRSVPRGIEVASSNGKGVRLSLDSVLVDGSSVDMRAATPRVDRNLAVYDEGDVRQYFVNGPLGLEQRFLVRRAPGWPARHLELIMDISGATGTALSRDGRSVLLRTSEGPALRYSGLTAIDSYGRRIPARMRLRSGRLALEVETRGARFPITVDPLLSPYAVLNGPSGPSSAFGSSIAVSHDGNTAAIGGESDNGGLGAVWVFTRSGTSWSQQGPKLTPQGSSPTRPRIVQNFGSGVAISADGNRIVVGDGRFGMLAAWAFARAGGVWHQQGAPLAPRINRKEVSGSVGVTLSGDGRTIALAGIVSSMPLTWVYVSSRGRWRQQGHPLPVSSWRVGLSENGNALLVGEASFIRSRSRWRAAGRISAGPGSEGSRAALSGDGLTAAVGNGQRGYALVYRRSRARWIRVARLTSPHPEAQLAFGASVTLSADGKTALIAASPRTESSGAKPVGYIFTRTNSDVWTTTAAVTMNQPWSAALSADGGTIVAPPLLREVAERVVDSGEPAHVLTRAGNDWQEQAALSPSDATGVDGRSFGGDFALSSDGSTAIIGEGPDTAWVFDRSGESWTRQTRLRLEGTVGGGGLVALSADGNTAVLAGPSAPGPVAAWAFTRTGATWSPSGTRLVASGAGPRPPGGREELESFASSVAISANGDVILVGASWDAGNTGATWVFTRSGSGWSQQGPKLTSSSPSTEEHFGNSVSLSASGDMALIGAVDHKEGPTEGDPPQGAAYVFARSAATWTQTAKLVDGEHKPYESRWGLANTVALSADGNTALLGGYNHALVFTRLATGWQQHRPALKASPYEHNAIYGSQNRFDAVVALSADGTRAVLGGPVTQGCGRYFEGPCTGTAVVWAFSRVGEAWMREPLPVVRGLPFGAWVAIAGNGETVLIQGVTPGSEPGGAVFVSRLIPPPQAGFVIEPSRVDYYGAVELQLWSPVAATFTATARVNPSGAGVPSNAPRCTDSRPAKQTASRRRCASGAPLLYGTTTARGVQNVHLDIAPRPAMRRYVARHKRVNLLITIHDKPVASPSSTQTIRLAVPFKKPPAPEF
jgi:hypothetical protein